MQLVFPPEMEAFIQQQLHAGKYRSSIDVVFAAMQLLQQQAQEEDIYKGRLAELQEDVRIG